MAASREALEDLANDLEELDTIISDHALRDSDPETHLNKLKAAFAAIQEKGQALKPDLDPRLNHFLERQSYPKALEWIRTQHLGVSDESA